MALPVRLGTAIITGVVGLLALLFIPAAAGAGIPGGPELIILAIVFLVLAVPLYAAYRLIQYLS
jgi:hypothetical protein